MIKNIIFDFDGVIENTYDFCYKIEKERNPTLNHNKFKLIYCNNYWNSVDKKHINKKYIENYENQYKKEIEKRKTKIEIKNMIKKLSKKYKLFIISSCSEKNINLYLKNNSINNLFIEVLGRETNFSKIKKFKTVFQKYNTNSKNCIFITDTVGDIKEANQVKIDSLAVTWGYHEKKLLEKEKPKSIINKPSEIINNLLNIRKNEKI